MICEEFPLLTLDEVNTVFSYMIYIIVTEPIRQIIPTIKYNLTFHNSLSWYNYGANEQFLN